MKNKITDLRGALELLKSIPGQLVETDVPVEPHAELSGVYRHVGAGGTVMRPTRQGPAMIFNSINGHPDARVVIGLLASRKRVGYLLDCPPEQISKAAEVYGPLFEELVRRLSVEGKGSLHG